MFRIRIHFFTDPDPKVEDPDPDPIRIQGLMTKNWKKITAEKKNLIFFWSKTAIYLSLGRVGIKKPTQKTQKNPLKVFFLGFFKFLISYENNTNSLFQTDFLWTNK